MRDSYMQRSRHTPQNRVSRPIRGGCGGYKLGRRRHRTTVGPHSAPRPHALRSSHTHTSRTMSALNNTIVCFLLLSAIVLAAKHKKVKPKKFVSPTTKGIQCYNCLSFDHPGCWDPDHPDYANITVPNIDCYIPGMAFLCIVITSESAKLVETGQEIGPVRARTCVPSKDFSKKSVSYSMCSKLSKELSASEIFSRIAVSRPQCTLCKKHLCTDATHC